MLSSISDDVKEEQCSQSFARARGVGQYTVKGVFKVNKEGKNKVEG